MNVGHGARWPLRRHPATCRNVASSLPASQTVPTVSRIGTDGELQQWLHAELEKPLDPAEVARAGSTPEIASEMYLASLMVADEQNFMERAYLDELAKQLRLEPSLKAQLERQLAQPQPPALP